MKEEIKQNWKERLKEFAIINEMFIRGFPMGKLEAFMEVELDLAVSKERSRIVEWIEERKKDKSQMVYKSYDEPVANSAYLKACDHIINLINTK